MRLVRLALRWLLLDWRAGELRLLVAALALAAAAVGTVDFFSDRVQRALTVGAVDLLAADAAVESSEAPAAEWEAEAQRRGLQTARTLTFPSVLVEGDVTQLVQVKAVSDRYPLRGRLRSAQRLEDRQGIADAPLEPGTAWGEARLFAQLGLAPGAAVGLGESRLALARVLTVEPDRGGDLFQFAPRLLLRLEDVPATGLVTPASRVSHRLLVAGRAADVDGYRNWLKPQLPKGAQLLDVSGARPELSAALDRGTRLLSLAAATVVVLAGAAALLAARRYVIRQTDSAAVLRCLGVSSRGLWVVFLTRLLGVAAVATVLGGLLGIVAQSALGVLVGPWFAAELPAPTLAPLGAAAATTLLVLIASVLPPLSRLPLTPPARVLRGSLGPPPLAEWITLGTAVGALAAFLLWRMGDLSLGTRAMAGVVGTLVVLGLATRGLIAVLGPLRRRGGSAWRYGLAALARHPTLTLVQGVGFGLGIMALLLLSVVRNDLMGAWRNKLPPETPNHFVINVQPDERAALADLLTQRGLHSAGVFPMIRGRLVSVAGKAVDPAAYESPRAQRLAAREFNLSFAERMQPDNRLLAGRWWEPATTAGEFSVESGIAETLGIAIGDELSFEVSGRRVAGKVANLRQVQWDSFNVNFFVVGNPPLLADLPATYIASFHLPPDRLSLLAEIARSFPSVTVIDVDAVLSQVRSLIERAALALEYVFFFTLGAGLLTLVAAVQATREVRAQEIAVLRTLGASRRRLLGAMGVEFATIGFIAGTIAAAGAAATGWLVAEAVFGLTWSFNPWLWPIGALSGAAGVGIAGLVAVRRLVSIPPVAVLRGA